MYQAQNKLTILIPTSPITLPFLRSYHGYVYLCIYNSKIQVDTLVVLKLRTMCIKT